MIWLIPIYLTGYLAAFLYIRWDMHKRYNGWSKNERAMALIYSLGSWFSLAACIAGSLPHDD